MDNTRLCSVMLDHIRSLGYNTGRAFYCDFQLGLLMICLDAVDTFDGHEFIVRAPANGEYEAVCELAKAVGIGLEDG
ncbi:MAG TPA: hypothetical protein VJZ71_16565 [Phycisphaerae bacterium]|nr:hypothetical protein [Phycisphaerae bacterium]